MHQLSTPKSSPRRPSGPLPASPDKVTKVDETESVDIMNLSHEKVKQSPLKKAVVPCESRNSVATKQVSKLEVSTKSNKYNGDSSWIDQGSQSNIKLQILTSFGIDQSEILLSDYKCSFVRGKVPIKGRLYITQRHVCYLSNLLNIEHRIVYSSDQIHEILKANDRKITIQGSNNVSTANGDKTTDFKSDFIFFSRQNRDDAFDYLSCLELAKCPPVVEHAHGLDPSTHHRNHTPKTCENNASKVTNSTQNDEGNANEHSKMNTHQHHQHENGSSEKPTRKEEPGVNELFGLSPFNIPDGQAMIQKLPNQISKEIEKWPLMVKTTMKDTTTLDIFR